MRLIDAEFEEKHYASMLINPTPDVTQEDKRKAQIVIDALKMAKTVDKEPIRHGEWFGERIIGGQIWSKCNKCGRERIKDKYCSNCGAKMEVIQNERIQ